MNVKKVMLIILTLMISNMSTQAQLKINFELSFPQAQTHYTDVKMHLKGLKKDFIDVKMPVWTPGSYLIREFQKSVEAFEASAKTQKLKFEKINKNTWRIWNHQAKEIEISYKVYAFETSVRTSFIDDSHAFISPTGVFMFVPNQLQLPSTVEIHLPKQWSKISTGLALVAGKDKIFQAPNFDVLYDSPFEIGNQDLFTFEAAGVTHTVAMYNSDSPYYDKEKLKIDMAKIVTEETKLFAENPNKTYTFIIHNLSAGSGGLEHLNSTTLGVQRDSYKTESGYKAFLELVAHEYFHLWNVKRLRPEALGPFNYDEENYTRELWIAEGITSYFENKFMIRAGFYNPDEFIKKYVNTLGTVINSPGAKEQSIAESGFDAWIKGYRPNENSINTGISYYSKGTLVGMMMDLEILHATKGEKSLDDVMKIAYQNFYKNRPNGYKGEEFKKLVEKISGISFDTFYEKYVNGTAPMEYNTYLGYAGYQLKNIAIPKPSFGALCSNINGKAVVKTILRNSAAWDSGLNVNDELVKIEDQVLTNLDMDSFINNKKSGETVKVTVLRDGILKTLSILLKESDKVQFSIASAPSLKNEEARIRKAWMGI